MPVKKSKRTTGPPVKPETEFDAAIRELRDLYNETVDIKERLAIRKEMNRMYRLYEEMKALAEAADTVESETLLEIRSHLEPLGLAADGTPIAELARLAALKLTEK